MLRGAEVLGASPSKHKVDQKQSEIEAERRLYSHPRTTTATQSRICCERKRTTVDKCL
jgi:hypothetical protein